MLLLLTAHASAATWPTYNGSGVAVLETRLATTQARGFVPAFGTAPRTRTALALVTRFNPGPQVTVYSSLERLWDQVPGETVIGWGDSLLGARWTPELGMVDGGIGWSVKLPNARDESGLGTDETDVSIDAQGQTDLGEVRVGLRAELGFLGHPKEFSTQQGVVSTWLLASTETGAIRWNLRSGGSLASGDIAARLGSGLGAEWGCALLLGADVYAGHTNQATDLQARLWVGSGVACPDS